MPCISGVSWMWGPSGCGICHPIDCQGWFSWLGWCHPPNNRSMCILKLHARLFCRSERTAFASEERTDLRSRAYKWLCFPVGNSKQALRSSSLFGFTFLSVLSWDIRIGSVFWGFAILSKESVRSLTLSREDCTKMASPGSTRIPLLKSLAVSCLQKAYHTTLRKILSYHCCIINNEGKTIWSSLNVFFDYLEFFSFIYVTEDLWPVGWQPKDEVWLLLGSQGEPIITQQMLSIIFVMKSLSIVTNCMGN